MSIDVKKIVVDHKTKSVVDINEFIRLRDNDALDTDICVETGDYVVPYSKEPKSLDEPFIYTNGMFTIANRPTKEEDKEKYSKDKVIDFSNNDGGFAEQLKKVYALKKDQDAGLTIVNNYLTLEIYDEDTPELKIIKKAINDKRIDSESYREKFGSASDYNNDMRALKSPNNHSISFFKAKRILNGFDLEGEFIVRDKRDAVNPCNEELNVILTDGD